MKNPCFFFAVSEKSGIIAIDYEKSRNMEKPFKFGTIVDEKNDVIICI